MAEHSAYIAYVRRPRRIDVINGRANGITRSQPQQEELRYREVRVKKTTSSKAWLDDPDVKRRQRVAKYKLYAVEGKVKSSFKKGMRWIKRKCSRIIHGYWRESEWYKPKKKGGREKEMVFGGVDSLIPLWKEKKKKKGKKEIVCCMGCLILPFVNYGFSSCLHMYFLLFDLLSVSCSLRFSVERCRFDGVSFFPFFFFFSFFCGSNC